MSSLGVVGGMMAGKAITSGNDKPSRPAKVVAQNPPQMEHNYTQYAHGNNTNAQPKPVTYDSFKGGSVVAQAGSTKSSTAAPHPQRQRPHRPHAHGNQPVSGAVNSSLHAFDNSVGAHTMTSSVLALNSASHNQSHQQSRPNPPHQGGQPVAGQGVPNTYAASGAKHSLLSAAWSQDAATTTGGRFDPNVLETDMAAAGFTPMHSKYKATKQGKSSHSTQPSQSHQPASNLVYSQVQPPMPTTHQHPAHQYAHHVGLSNPVHLQQQQQQYQQQSPASLPQGLAPIYPTQPQYGPRPITVPNQGLSAPYIHPSYSYPVTYSQAPPAEYGGLSHMQHQSYPMEALSQSVPATYDINNQPMGLASSVPNFTHSLPQLVHVSSDNIPPLRPKKRVHFADNC
ncbi:hypothetical protein LPJ60_003235 [Coemansia sp. RSA 2675]|nr:hypothetical protein LPJ60_003235 [Coemansia sp. RSA 2675]